MSIQQLSKFLNDQNGFRRQARGYSCALFFQYDYSESQQGLRDRFPSSNLFALAGLRDWDWFIDEKSQPNIRPSFYNPKLHIPMGPVLAPATRIEQCELKMAIAVVGFAYTLSFKDLDALAQEQCSKGRQQLYVPVQLQSKSINGFDRKMMLATIFVDMASTRDGSIDLANESTNLKWVTAIKRMRQTAMPDWFVANVETKLRGRDKSIEPFHLRLNPNPPIDPQTARRQAAFASLERLKQQQKQQQQQGQQERQKQKKAPNRPMITFSQAQRDSMLQQILKHGIITPEQVLKLTGAQRTLIVDTYLRKQQKAMYLREKAEKKRLEEAFRVSAARTGIPRQQWNVQASEQQTNPREEATLNDIVRKQKDTVREQDSRGISSMPPPAQSVRRFSQSSPGKGQAPASAQLGNSRPLPQLNYPQNPNNRKRPASNSISSVIETPDAKRQNTRNGETRRLASGLNLGGKGTGPQNFNGNGQLTDPVSNSHAQKNSSDTQKPKPKARGRPRKSRAKLTPAGDSKHPNQHEENNQVALDKSQVHPHVEQAAKMVGYFQPKADAEKARGGRLL